jgi:hypothetical protein
MRADVSIKTPEVNVANVPPEEQADIAAAHTHIEK